MSTNAEEVEVVLQIAVQGEEDVALLPPAKEFGLWVNAALVQAQKQLPVAPSVTIRIVEEAESAALNGDFRGKTGPTNVLAFPAPEVLIPAAERDETELGDLVICIAIAVREAREQGKPFVAHLAHLVVHGSLHLLGYDHMADEDATAMESLERQVLDTLGFPDPFQETESTE